MFSWLFNSYMDGVEGEVCDWTQERGCKMREWLRSQKLSADTTALAAESVEQLQYLVKEFAMVCERRKLNECEKKVLVVGRG